ncbi:MAG: class E sortase [Micrococcaceae bacterium]
MSKTKSSSALTFLQVFGELILTAGVIAMLYVVWQLFYTDYTADKAQKKMVHNISKNFSVVKPAQDNNMSSFGDPVVDTSTKQYGQQYGVIYIPRFGADYSRPLVQGTGVDILDTLGIGHYVDSQEPGQVGNFAVAGHRNTSGSVLNLIGELQPGDHIYVQTKDGFYQYTYRNSMYIHPSRSDVIDPVPTVDGAKPNERYMTLTSCHPRYTDHERVAAYAVYTGWRPASAGAPAEIAKIVAQVQGDA